MTLSKREQNVGTIISMLAITVVLIYLVFGIFGFQSEEQALMGIGISLLFSMLLCVVVLRKYRRAGNPAMIDYLNVGTQRYILALLMVTYGIDKLVGNFFDYQLSALDSKMADVSEFQLAWFFYGKNRWQELFAGVMEFVPGLLLLHRRTYYVAALILLPVTAQVFLLNFFFKIGGITFPVATVLMTCNMYIIYSQKQALVQFFRALNFTIVDKLAGKARIIVGILKSVVILLAALLIFVKVKPVFFTSPAHKTYQALVGVYTLKSMKKNGVAYQPINDSTYYKDLYIEKQDRWNILRRFDNEMTAFILKLNPKNDSLSLYINKGGAGDEPDIIDTATVLKGVYEKQGKMLTISGVQLSDTLELMYERQDRIKAKEWFW